MGLTVTVPMTDRTRMAARAITIAKDDAPKKRQRDTDGRENAPKIQKEDLPPGAVFTRGWNGATNSQSSLILYTLQ